MVEWSKAPHWKCGEGETPPRVRIPLSPPFFLSLFLSYWKKYPCYYFVKSVDSKGFSTFLSVCKKHTQTLKSDRFAMDFVLNLIFSEKCKNKILFVSDWLSNITIDVIYIQAGINITFSVISFVIVERGKW